MRLAIDADQLIYAAGFTTEEEPLSHACQLVKKKLAAMHEDCGTKESTIYIGGKGNFREDIVIDYKANRTADKPIHYEGIKKYLVEVHGAVRVDHMEVDDQVSIELWEDYVIHDRDPDKCQVILCSPDKDLNNTPGWHYNPRTREKYWVTDEQAYRHFHYQLLAGDSCDNIKGLPYCAPLTFDTYTLHHSAKRGCGGGAAKKLMAEAGNCKNMVYFCYADWGNAECMSMEDTLAYLTQQGQLLWMVREVDEFDEPVMWTPDGELFRSIWEEVEKEVWEK
jgi:5'-3' exonuclease